MLEGTPFHARTAVLCQAQNWRRWAGYLAASSYELVHDREYYAIRSAAALIDVSPIYKYQVRGRDALRLLNRMVTRDVRRCAVGQVIYTPWCDAAGKVIDDGLVARLEQDSFRLTSAEPNLRWLGDNALGLEVTIDDLSESVAGLALQGPTSRQILARVAGPGNDVDVLRYMGLMEATLGSIPALVSRTGYTGDLGYEIWVEARHAVGLWDLLMEAGQPYGLLPAGMLALDLARLEAGLILIDVDYVPAPKALIPEQTSSPDELGLGWAVSLNKGAFNGRAALLQEQRRRPEWRLAGLEVDWAALESLYAEVGLPPRLPAVVWRESVPVYHRGEQVGYATSGGWSPLLKKVVALAHLQAGLATQGTRLSLEVTVEHRRRQAVARVVPLPFLDPARKRESL